MQKSQALPSSSVPLLSPDLQFLIACCQTEPSQEDLDFILSFQHKAGSVLPPLLELAGAHGVIPLVYKALKKLADDGLLDSKHIVLTTCKDAYLQIARRNMLMTAELSRIMKMLEENGIKALAFKGPTLAQLAYGDITLRQFGDLDILVNETQIVPAGTVLSEYGYQAEYSIKILENATCRGVINDLGFRHTSVNVFLELHWRLFREKIGQHLDFEQISKHTHSAVISGISIATLSPEMLLVYLCLHGSKHAWERLEWLCDIDRLIRMQPIDWEITRTIAEAMDTSTTLYLGLNLCHELFNTPLTESFLTMTHQNRIAELTEQTYKLLDSLCKKEGYSKYNTIHLYQMALLNTRTKKLQHLLATYFSISRNDCQQYPLPSALKFLYIFIKPVRIAYKYLRYGK
ncbi:nucleotidyltransferase family protein [Sulfurimonas sp. HSL-1656]|uniref:nucleotidyltransferase domain-containing protein n=1 Tax=Thiomicrolovo subterrani TaxID=3131934 RepID=UPI0031F8EA49